MDSSTSRRDFLIKGAAATGITALGASFADHPAQAAQAAKYLVSVRDFGAKGDGKKDDTAALRKAFASVPEGTAVFLPRGDYLISGAIDMKPNRSMMGEPFGAKIIVKHYDAPAVRVPVECRVSDIAFVYPDNTDINNPKPAPETISLIGNGAGYIENITFSHAFIGVGTPEAGANCGQSVIRKLNGFVHDTMVRIDGSLDIVRIENVHCFVPGGEDSKAYYRSHRKCFHIKASDGTLISKSFMIFGKTFLLKEPGKHGAGLSTYLSQCWFEGMSSHGIQVNDANRIAISDVEMSCAYAKALVELNNGAFARISSCYIRDSMHSKGIVINSGSGATISGCEFWGSPGFTAIEINSDGHTIVSNNFVHHCEVGVNCTKSADNYTIMSNHISGNNTPIQTSGGGKTIIKDNL